MKGRESGEHERRSMVTALSSFFFGFFFGVFAKGERMGERGACTPRMVIYCKSTTFFTSPRILGSRSEGGGSSWIRYSVVLLKRMGRRGDTLYFLAHNSRSSIRS